MFYEMSIDKLKILSVVMGITVISPPDITVYSWNQPFDSSGLAPVAPAITGRQGG
jgi:hypothetical protein